MSSTAAILATLLWQVFHKPDFSGSNPAAHPAIQAGPHRDHPPAAGVHRLRRPGSNAGQSHGSILQAPGEKTGRQARLARLIRRGHTGHTNHNVRNASSRLTARFRSPLAEIRKCTDCSNRLSQQPRIIGTVYLGIHAGFSGFRLQSISQLSAITA